MLIYKVIGGGSIMVSALIFYFESQSFNKKAMTQLDAYISLIEYIKSQVSCFLSPIDIIIKNCDYKIIQKCTMVNEINIQTAKTVKDIVNYSYFYLDQEIIDTIYKFANDFGSNYRKEQLLYCDAYIEELKKYKCKIYDNYEKDKKVRFVLCMCLSFSMILMLI